MKNVTEIQDKMTKLFNDVIEGTVQLQQANTAARIVREKARIYESQRKVAESQNKLEQLNEFYGLK